MPVQMPLTDRIRLGALASAALTLFAAGCSTEGLIEPELQQAANRNGSIQGAVHLAHLGACSGVTVAVEGPGVATVVTAAAEGAFAVTGLAPGAYAVRIGAAGWEPYEEIFVYGADAPRKLGTVELAVATVAIKGTVDMADGESPAGTAVEVSSEVELASPEGVECGLPEASFLDSGSAVAGADGGWSSRVPRSSREVRGRTARPGYTRGEVTASADDLAAAGGDEPVDMGTATLFPLTGFVNVAGGEVVNQSVVTLQISAFNASQIAITDGAGGTACAPAADFRPFAAEVTYGLGGGDGLRRICVTAINGAGDEAVFGRDVRVDTTPPGTPDILIGDGTGVLDRTTANLRIVSAEAGSGLDRAHVSEDGGPAQERLYSSVLAHTFDGDGPHRITAVVTDGAGNASGVGSAWVTVDTEAPSYTLTGSLDGTTARLVLLPLAAAGPTPWEVRVGYARNGGGEALDLAQAPWIDLAGAAQGVPVTATVELPATDGDYAIETQARDGAGNASPVVALGHDLTVDRTAPVNAGFAIAGPATVSDPTLTLNLEAEDGAGGSVTAQVAAEPGFGEPTEFAFGGGAASPDYTLADTADGSHTLYARYCDGAGNCTGTFSDAVVLDRTQPTGSVSIGGGAYTTDGDLALTLIASGADEMRIAENPALAGAAWIPYATAYNHTVTGGEGTVTVYAQFRDAAGNVTGPVTAAVTYDGTAPAAGTGITLNGGAAATTDRDVTVHLDVPADATEMIVAGNTGFSGAAWQSTAASVGFRLAAGDGNKTVYAKWRDAAGNETATLSDDIVLDTEPPVLGSPAIAAAGGAEYTAADPVALALDAAGAVRMQIDDDENFASPEWDTGFAAVTQVAAPASDGTAAWYVRFQDAAGNWTDARSDSVVIDRTAPELAGLTVNDGSAWTGDGVVRVEPLATDANPLARVELSTDGFATVAADRPYSPAFDHDLGLAEGEAATLSVRVVDAAGNTSPALTSTTITRDTTPPSPGSPAIRIAGGAYQTSRFVVLELAGGDAAEVRLANNPDFTGAAWQAVTDEVAWSLSSGDGPKQVFAEFRDAAGNVAGPFADQTTVDTMPPANPKVLLGKYGAHTTERVLDVDLEAGMAYSYAVSTDTGMVDPVTGTMAGATANTTLALPSADGFHTVYALFTDRAGNESSLAQASLTLDRSAPSAAELVIDGGAAKTNDPLGQVQLGLFAADATGGSGIAGVRLGNSAAAATAAPPEPYTQTKPWTLAGPHSPGTDGDRTVWAIYHDAAGNRSAPVSATIRFDRAAPAGNMAFVAPATNQSLAAVDLSYPADTAEMKLSQGDACAGGSWAGVTDATLINLNLVDGVRWASVRFRDDAGNTGPCATAAITVDTAGPVPQTMALTGNPDSEPGYTKTPNLTLSGSAAGVTCTWQASEDVGFIQVRAEGAGCSPDLPYILGGNDGEHTVYLRFADALGNVGPVTAQSIVLDTDAPAAGPGGFTIAEAPYTNDVDVTLDADVTGADQMRVAQAGSCGGAWQPFADPHAVTLAGGGTNELSVAYRDAAGNATACYTRAVTVDTVLGTGWFPVLTGIEGDTSRTAGVAVTLDVVGADPDVVEMRVSNSDTFADANWIAFDSSLAWTLPGGDGGKTVYVELRDRAGNVNGDDASITLDQTPPDPPVIQLADLNGDGFQLTTDTTELAWSQPAESDRFELQRLVEGIDGQFATIAVIAAADPAEYTDAVTDATRGRVHRYRVRAVDAIGNASAWSLDASALPYEPIRSAAWVQPFDGTERRYDFVPSEGVFSVQSIHRYADATGTTDEENLVLNATSWWREAPDLPRFDEALVLRTANQDNSLVIDSEVPLGLAERQLILSNNGSRMDLVQDQDGSLHAAFSPGPNLYYARNTDGTWEISQSLDNDGQHRELDLAIGADGRPSIAYTVCTPWPSCDFKLRHIQFSGTGDHALAANWWQSSFDPNTDRRDPSVAVAPDGTTYVSYWNRAAGDLMLATHAGAGWVTATVDDHAFNRGQLSTLAHDPTDDSLHIFHYDESANDLLYTHNRSGSWVTTTVAGTGHPRTGAGECVNSPDYPPCGGVAVVTDATGRFHLAFGDTTDAEFHYAVSAVTGWTLETVDSGEVGAQPSMALAGNGQPIVAYWDYGNADLKYARRVGGAWEPRTVDVRNNTGLFPGLSIDANETVTIHYYDETNFDLWAAELPQDPVTSEIPNIGGDVELAVDADGVPHLSYDAAATGVMAYARYDDGGWQTEMLDFDGSTGRNSQIAIDPGGGIHLAWADLSADTIHYAERIAGSWSITLVDTVPSLRNMDLAVDGNGGAHLAYWHYNGSDYDLYYATNAGGSWQVEPTPVDSNGFLFTDAMLEVGPGDTVYLDSRGSARRYFRPATGSAWDLEFTASCNDGDMVVDADGVFHYSCRRATDNALVYNRDEDGSVETTVIDSGGKLATVSSIRVADDGTVHILYNEESNFDLKYATNASGRWVAVMLDERGSQGSNIGLDLGPDGTLHLANTIFYSGQPDVIRYARRFQGVESAASVEQTGTFE